MAGVWDDYYNFFVQDSTTHAADASSLISGGVNVFELAAGTQGAPHRALKPTAASYETVNRTRGIASTSPLTSGTEQYVGIYLPKDFTAHSVVWFSGTQAAVAPTHAIAGLRDSAGIKLAASADGTSTAWAANAARTFVFSADFTTTYAGLHYLTLMMTVTTTLPDLLGVTSSSVLAGLAPKIAATGDASLTTSIPSTGGTLTAVATIPYAYVVSA